jgi:histidyl-tRNA synthetase
VQAFDKAGKLRAICGGGRYDKLLSTFGGSDCPASGFGFGDAVIIEVMGQFCFSLKFETVKWF